MKISSVNYHINIIWNNLLQFASDVITICVHLQLLQNAAALVTKCVSWIYYKMLQPLLHNAHIITKCRNCYYKMRNLLQNALLLQNAAEQCHYSIIILQTLEFMHVDIL